MQYQENRKANHQEKGGSNDYGLCSLFPVHFLSAPVARRIGHLIDRKSVGKLAFFFLNGYITEFFVDEKGIILTGEHIEIDNYNSRIAINDQVARIIPVE
jgi:hypothetical protein